MSIARYGSMISAFGFRPTLGSTAFSIPFWLTHHVIVNISTSDDILQDIGRRLDDLAIPKSRLGWELDELEAAVKSCQYDSCQESASDSDTSDSSE